MSNATFFRVTLFAAAFSSAAFGQSVISAKAGLVHYTEGDVYLGDKQIDVKPTEFPQLQESQVLRTALGRAEILLTPGVFLRMSENSAVRMIGNRLADTRVELISGTGLVEVAEVSKEQAVTLLFGDAQIEFRKPGLFRVESDPARFRAYDGEAVLTYNGQTVTVKESREVALAGVAAPEKFDSKTGDAFYRWAGRRAGYISAANLSSAQRINELGSGWSNSGWFWNQYLGMFTYVPSGGNWISPFGYRYYSPRTVYAIYAPPPPPMYSEPSMMESPGYRGYSQRGGMSGYSGRGSGGYSSAPASAGPSAPAPAAGPRDGGSGGSRESGSRR